VRAKRLRKVIKKKLQQEKIPILHDFSLDMFFQVAHTSLLKPERKAVFLELNYVTKVCFSYTSLRKERSTAFSLTKIILID